MPPKSAEKLSPKAGNPSSKASEKSIHLPSISKNGKNLDRLVKQFKAKPHGEYNTFIHKIDSWYRQKRLDMLDLTEFAFIHKTPYPVIKGLLKDFGIPCNDTEIHAICRELDKNNDRLISMRKVTHLVEDPPPTINTFQTDVLEIPDCYLTVSFRFIPFLTTKQHPSHFEAVIRAETYIGMLGEIIEKHTNMYSKHWCIHTSDKPTHTNALSHEFILAQLHCLGGTEYNPGRITLYYDGYDQYNDHPILNCDFYCRWHVPKQFPVQNRRLQKQISAHVFNKKDRSFSRSNFTTCETDVQND